MKRILGATAAIIAALGSVGSASAQYVQHYGYQPYYQPRVVYVQHTSPFVYFLEIMAAIVIVAVVFALVRALVFGPSRPRYGYGQSSGGSIANQAINQLARLQGQFNEMVNRNYGVTVRSIFYGPEVPFQSTPFFSTAAQQLAQARNLINARDYNGALAVLTGLESTLIEADRYMYWSTFNSPVFLADPYAVAYANALGFQIGMEFAFYSAFLSTHYIWAADSFLFCPPLYDVAIAPGFDFCEVIQPDFVVADSYVVSDIPTPDAAIIDAAPGGAFDEPVVVDNGGWGNSSSGAVIDDGFQGQVDNGYQQPADDSFWGNNSGGAVIEDNSPVIDNGDGGWGNDGGGDWGGDS